MLHLLHLHSHINKKHFLFCLYRLTKIFFNPAFNQSILQQRMLRTHVHWKNDMELWNRLYHICTHPFSHRIKTFVSIYCLCVLCNQLVSQWKMWLIDTRLPSINQAAIQNYATLHLRGGNKPMEIGIIWSKPRQF